MTDCVVIGWFSDGEFISDSLRAEALREEGYDVREILERVRVGYDPKSHRSFKGLVDDAGRLDWLDQNIFHREMDEWDSKFGGHGADSMWVMFAPKGPQGTARNIIDAAKELK